MIQRKESSLVKFSTSTYKHEFKSSQLVTTILSVFIVLIFSISLSCQCICSLSILLSYNKQFLASFSPNLEFTEAYPIRRFAVTCINYSKKRIKRASFMLPGTNFATLNVHTKKASLDALCV